MELIEVEPLPDSWRENVAAIVMDAAGRVLLGLGCGRNAYWHFPQGGVGSKETWEEAIRRELMEEVALPPSAYRMVACYGGLRYRYRRSNDKSGRWRGQEQTWFLILCHDEMPPVDCSHTDEFATLTWVPWRELSPELFSPFKRKVVEKVLATFFPANLPAGDPIAYACNKLTTRRCLWGGRSLATCPTDDRALFGGGKEEMESQMEKLSLRLRAAQKSHASRRGRLLVLLHGHEASGRRQCLRRLSTHLDPLGLRGVREGNAFAPGFPWQLLESLPTPGSLSLLLHNGADGEPPVPQDWCALESWLAGQGIRLLKLCLHASPPVDACAPSPSPLDEGLLAATDTPASPWYIIPADRRWYRDYVVATLVAEALECGLNPLPACVPACSCTSHQ